jgi:hypothetical protein
MFKNDITQLRSDIKSNITQLKTELQGDIRIMKEYFENTLNNTRNALLERITSLFTNYNLTFVNPLKGFEA